VSDDTREAFDMWPESLGKGLGVVGNIDEAETTGEGKFKENASSD